GAPGFDSPALAVNASGGLVAGWRLDTQGTTPIGLAVARGKRSSLPSQATQLPTDGQDVSQFAVVVDAKGHGVVAWIQTGSAGATVKAATLRPGQVPQTVVLSTRADATLLYLSLGLDGSS